MAKPDSSSAPRRKDNSKKLHANRERWQRNKRAGRPKQVWNGQSWEKVVDVPAAA